MLQIVKRIVAHRDSYVDSEKKRGHASEHIDEIILLNRYTRVITTNIEIIASIKNKISAFFKIMRTGPQTLTIPLAISADIKLLSTNEPLNFNVRYTLEEATDVLLNDMEDVKDIALKIHQIEDILRGELKIKSSKLYEMAENVGNLLSVNVPDAETEEVYTYDNDTGINYNHDICHADIMTHIGLEWGKDIADIAGNRAYVLSKEVFMLKHALMSYVIDFAVKKGYTMMNVPVFMNYDSMRKVCQLSDFEETLYEVSDKSKAEKDTPNKVPSKFYLTATSEQFLVAYHNNKKLKKNELPKRYCAHNECFRKETGSHGRDTSGIFRIHQFDKFEQFIVCNPDESTNELHKLLNIIKEFYESLDISFKIIAMSASDINQSTSIKYDLEAYFPYSKNYKELVSCSNCTDYQAIKVNCKVENEYVHMLNCTLCAIQRTLCCICETYWDNDTKILNIPTVLKQFMPS